MQGASGGHPQKQAKGSKPFPGKAKPKYNAHSVVLKTVLSATEGKSLSEMDKATVQNLVTSEAGGPLSKAAKRGNSVLSGSDKQSKASLHTHNVFSCDSIHDTGDSSLDQCQTDTDPSGRLCIMADIQVRAKAKSQTQHQSESRPKR